MFVPPRWPKDPNSSWHGKALGDFVEVHRRPTSTDSRCYVLRSRSAPCTSAGHGSVQWGKCQQLPWSPAFKIKIVGKWMFILRLFPHSNMGRSLSFNGFDPYCNRRIEAAPMYSSGRSIWESTKMSAKLIEPNHISLHGQRERETTCRRIANYSRVIVTKDDPESCHRNGKKPSLPALLCCQRCFKSSILNSLLSSCSFLAQLR